MKTSSTAFTALLALIPLFASATDLSTRPLPSMKLPSVHARFRDLQLSQTCEDAIEELSNDPDFSAANTTKFQEMENIDMDRFCSISNTKIDCNIDSCSSNRAR